MSEHCCNGACRRKQPIRVLMSDLTGRVYALTRWTRYGGDGLHATEKHDVTDDVTALMQRAWNQGWDTCAATAKGETVINPYAPKETTDA